jgi:plasmid replication initiation protein
MYFALLGHLHELKYNLNIVERYKNYAQNTNPSVVSVQFEIICWQNSIRIVGSALYR